jgi:antitoxin (DNA-binding transcriptional repressor) of toxin-antitoxin stability system
MCIGGVIMQFVSTRELRNSPQIWDSLSRNEDIVVTNNGKPTAFLIAIPPGQFEQVLDGIHKARENIKLPLSSPDERAAAWHEFSDALELSPAEPVPEFERIIFARTLDL